MLTKGSQAPDFSGLDQDGQRVTLGTLLEAGRLVLYFYPRDFTRVCTQQACLFRDVSEDLKALGTNVVGVSTDTSDSHQRFAKEHGLKFRLIADPDRQICKLYEADRWLISMSKRITYLIDTDRTILGAFQHELSAQKHLDDVLLSLR